MVLELAVAVRLFGYYRSPWPGRQRPDGLSSVRKMKKWFLGVGNAGALAAPPEQQPSAYLVHRKPTVIRRSSLFNTGALSRTATVTRGAIFNFLPKRTLTGGVVLPSSEML